MERTCPLLTNTMIPIVILLALLAGDAYGNLYKFDVKHDFNKHSQEGKRVKKAIKYDGTLDNLIGKPGDGYYLEVEIGTPKQKLNALIDTGSSNFAVACDASLNVNQYFKINESSTFYDTGRKLSVPYTQGSWEGILGQDFITFTSFPSATVKVDIACITHEENFFINGSNWHGILGLGYAEIARPDSSIEPVFDTMVREERVEDWFSVDLCGVGSVTQEGTVNGSILFGSTDPALYTGELYSTPIIKEWYYEVIISDIQVNGQSLNMDCKEYNFDRTIVDTGTTNLRLPDRVFNALVKQMKHNMNTTYGNVPVTEEFWTGIEFLCLEEDRILYDVFPTVTLTLPSNDTYAVDLIVAAQQYLRLVMDSKAEPGQKCFKFGISSIEEGPVIGAVILEGYYVVFDRLHRQVRFGMTSCPPADSVSKISTLAGRQWTGGNYRDCAYKRPSKSEGPNMMNIVYAFVAICALCMLPLLYLIQQQYCRRGCTKPQRRRTESETPVTDNMVDDDS